MEVSALKYSGGIGLHGRSPLLRLQSDERLVALVRRGNAAAFEVLVGRYEARLLAFCRHMLGSREDAEDILQDVMTSAYNAMLGDDRPINVRPWLYRIARNRSLNHMRRTQALAVDSMDVHLSDHGATTADKVSEREEFRLLVGDIHALPETQRTALVLREMDALSYEQIAEAMETTVPSVKSLLVRARVSLAEAAEARLLSCEEVRTELGAVAEGLIRKPGPLVRRHLKTCSRCETFRMQLKDTNRALAALLPIGPMAVLRQLLLAHLGHSAGSGATAAGSSAAGAGGSAGVAGAGAAGASGVTAGAGVAFGSGAGGFVSAGMGAIAGKAAAGLAAAALVTAGAVAADHTSHHTNAASLATSTLGQAAANQSAAAPVAPVVHKPAPATRTVAKTVKQAKKVTATTATQTTPTTTATTPTTTTAKPPTAGHTDTTTVATVLPPSDAGTPAADSAAVTPTMTPTTSTSTTTTPTDTGTSTSTTTTPTDTGTSTSPTTTTTATSPTETTPTTTLPTDTTTVSSPTAP